MSINDISLPPGVTPPPNLPVNFTLPPGFEITNETSNTDLANLFTPISSSNGVASTGAENTGSNLPAVIAEPFFFDRPMYPYIKTKSTMDMAGIPRFKHSSDFSYLFASNPDGTLNANAQDDYITGLVFVGCFLLIFFLVWSIVLLIFKFCINGFLSGDPFTNPHLKDPSAQKLLNRSTDEEMEEEQREWRKRPIRVRFTFLIAGLLQITFAILIVTKGIASLQETTDNIEYSSEAARLLLDEAASVSNSLLQIGDTADLLKDQIIFDLDKDNFCPDNPSFNETQAGKDITGATDAAVEMLSGLGDFIKDDVAGLAESLDDGNDNLDGVDEFIRTVEQYEWVGGLVAFPYLILTSLMIVGTLAAAGHVMTDCFLCFLNWTVLPLYVFVTIISYLATSFMSIFASMNADLCGGESSTPDQVIVDILVRSGFQEDDLFFKTARYYAFQCTRQAQEDPFLFLRQYDAEILQGREIIQDLTTRMTDISLEQLSLGCNRDFLPLHRSLSQMVGVMDALIQASNRALKVLDCEEIVPIYRDIVYDGTCTHAIKGLTWLFTGFFLVSVMGMILIMLRSSYQNTIFEGQEEDEIIDNEPSIVNHQRTKPPETKKTTSGSDRECEKDEALVESWDDEDVIEEEESQSFKMKGGGLGSVSEDDGDDSTSDRSK